MPLTPLPHVNLDAIERPVAGTITFQGEQHDVLQANGLVYAFVKQAEAAQDSDSIDAIYNATAEVVPSLGLRVRSMSPEQAGQVIALSCNVVEQVAATAPKSKRRTATKTAKAGTPST